MKKMKTKTYTITFTVKEANALLDILWEAEESADNNPYLSEQQRALYETARLRIFKTMYPSNQEEN
jgi:hypothetical protein